MSFLAGRIAHSEGKYFKEESEAKAAELRKRLQPKDAATANPGSPSAPGRSAASTPGSGAAAAAETGLSDVLPEVLSHNIPLSLRAQGPNVGGAAETLGPGEVPRGFSAADVAPRLEGGAGIPGMPSQLTHRSVLAQVPQTRLGPAKYQLAFSEPRPALASTANERRQAAAAMGARGRQLGAEQAKAMKDALVMVSKAFGVATLIVYGGAAVGLGLGMKAIGVEKIEDIPDKGRQFLEPRAAAVRRALEPWRDMLEAARKDWSMTEEQQRAVGQKYAEVLRAKERSKSVQGDS